MMKYSQLLGLAQLSAWRQVPQAEHLHWWRMLELVPSLLAFERIQARLDL
jgi:hypothetical protein